MALLTLSPTLEERLCTGSEQELFHIANMVIHNLYFTGDFSLMPSLPDLERSLKCSLRRYEIAQKRHY
jgi:hypothetical protein